MNKIEQIREMLNCLPEKDIKIANSLLDKRKFVELKELVDSDVYKAANKRFTLAPEDMEGEPTKECLEAEAIYDAMKELQIEVSIQASAFEPEEEEFIDPWEM